MDWGILLIEVRTLTFFINLRGGIVQIYTAQIQLWEQKMKISQSKNLISYFTFQHF